VSRNDKSIELVLTDVYDQQKTDIENQKYVIPMFINEHSVNGIRDTGNFLYKPGISRSGLAIWL